MEGFPLFQISQEKKQHTSFKIRHRDHFIAHPYFWSEQDIFGIAIALVTTEINSKKEHL